MTQHALQLQIVAKTNVGKVREHNEDNFIVTNDVEAAWVVPAQPYHNPPQGSIMVVADGMGGMNAGEVASKITIDSIYAFFREKIAKDLSPSERLVAAIQYAHQQVLEYAAVNLETEGMGTTVVAAHILNDKLYVAWSGDSRCYLFRGGTLSQLTKDHSYVQTLLDEGKITKMQAFYHPQSNVILQSLGDSERPPAPDVVVETLYQDDIVLLCSDGLNSMIEDHTIESILQHQTDDLTIYADKLIEAANEAGGNDNITVVLNRVIKGSPYLAAVDDNVTVITTVPNNIIPPKKKQHTGVWVLLGGLVAMAGLIAWFYPELQKRWKNSQEKGVEGAPLNKDTLIPTAAPEQKENSLDQEPQNEKQKNTQTQVGSQSAEKQKATSPESGEPSAGEKLKDLINDLNPIINPPVSSTKQELKKEKDKKNLKKGNEGVGDTTSTQNNGKSHQNNQPKPN